MANPRTRARIEARIHERVAYCIEFELSDPRSSFITVTKVEVTNDLSQAKILYSVLGSAGDKTRTAHMLEDATGFIRKQVGRVLRTRRIPGLVWAYDDSIEFQAEMEEKIAGALAHDREVNPQAHTDLPLAPEQKATEEEEIRREYDEFLDSQDGEKEER